MALPHGLTALSTHPRAAPPSTISTSSSTSSNATIRPQVLTPRATSPTSRVGIVGKLYANPPGSGNRPRQNQHWVGRPSVHENTAIVNAKTVLAGLRWRLEQYLDISPPYGLIIPDMVESARQDMEITGPALDLLASAVFADGDPPVCELPLVQEDASGKPFCNDTIPITVKTCPDALKSILESWSKVVPRVRALEPRLHGEIARIICDLDPLANVINPHVTKLAADIRKIADDFKEQRQYLTFVEETLKMALKQQLDAKMSIIVPPRIGILDNVREESESVASSSSSRSSSRASNRSLSRARSTSSLRNNNASGDGKPPVTGVRPRASNTSLRIGEDGTPLGDDEAEGGGSGTVSRSNELNRLPRAFVVPPSPRHQEHWSAPNAQYDASELSNGQADIYGGLLPLSIPAYSDKSPNKNLLDITNLPIQQSRSAPVSPSGSEEPLMATFTRLELGSSSSPRGRQLPRPPGSSSNSPSNNVGSFPIVGTAPVRTKGPRPLPSRPPRSPQPGGPNGTTSANTSSTIGSITVPDVGSSFVVPDQSSTSTSNMGGGSAALLDISTFSVPSNVSETFQVPSSSSDYDLQNARQQYLQSSLTQPPLSRSGSRRHEVNRHNARMRLEYGDAGSSSWASNTAPSSPQFRPSSAESAPPVAERRGPAAPSNPRLRDYASIDRLQGNSSFQQPLHASSSMTQLDRRTPGESSWGAPTTWKEPPVVVPSDSNPNSHSRPIGGIFRGVKEWMTTSRHHHHHSDSSKDEDVPPLPPKDGSPRASADAAPRAPNSASYQSSPDSALAYYLGTVPPTPPHHTREGQPAYGPPTSAPPRAQSFQPTNVGSQAERSADRVDTQQRFANDYPLTSPGYAELYQRNPLAASSYNGAGSSSSRPAPTVSGRSYNSLYNGSGHENFPHPTNSYPHASSNGQPLHVVPSVPSSTPIQPPKSNPDIDTIRQTMYGAIAEALATPALREITIKDAERAYFSAMSLAILNVSVTLQDPTQDSPNLVTMMSRQMRLTDLPGAYKACMTELVGVGREARKLGEEDDERAIAYVARGKSLPEPRLGRVRKLLERGMGYVDPTGRVRGASNSNSGGTGRSREFSSRIATLSLEMMKLPDFQGQQELFKILTVAR